MTDFTLDNYRLMLTEFAKAGYAFTSFKDAESAREPYLILRHDIDVSLSAATDIAAIEHEMGIPSTFFIAARSPFYNILSSTSAQTLVRLRHLGRDVAAHLDLSIYGREHERAILEIDLLSEFYPHTNKEIASLHHPGDLAQLEILMDCLPIRPVYEPVLKGKVTYVSDSTGRWRFGNPLELPAFRNKENIQLLTHPIWWVQTGKSPLHKLRNWVQHNCDVLFEEGRDYLPTLFKLEG